jgi:RND family efflux transporter MFP subunit
VQLDNAERESSRAAELLGSQAISAEEAESRSARLAESRAGVLAAEAALRSAELDLEFTSVRAPVAGRVGQALVTPGNFVSGIPAANTVLTTIVSIDPVYVNADVDENSLLALRGLMKDKELPLDAEGRVRVEVGLSDEDGYPHPGSIESIGNRLDAGTGSILLRAIVRTRTRSSCRACSRACACRAARYRSGCSCPSAPSAPINRRSSCSSSGRTTPCSTAP